VRGGRHATAPVSHWLCVYKAARGAIRFTRWWSNESIDALFLSERVEQVEHVRYVRVYKAARSTTAQMPGSESHPEIYSHDLALLANRMKGVLSSELADVLETVSKRCEKLEEAVLSYFLGTLQLEDQHNTEKVLKYLTSPETKENAHTTKKAIVDLFELARLEKTWSKESLYKGIIRYVLENVKEPQTLPGAPFLQTKPLVKEFEKIYEVNTFQDIPSHKTHAVVLITSADNNGEPFWVKLSTLLGLYQAELYFKKPVSQTTTAHNKKVFEQLKSFTEITKSFAPLFQEMTVSYKAERKTYSGIICTMCNEESAVPFFGAYNNEGNQGSWLLHSDFETPPRGSRFQPRGITWRA
jgi:hypothetical protein